MATIRHNHITRDIKNPGVCPACDKFLHWHQFGCYDKAGFPHDNECECWCHEEATRKSYKDRGAEFDAWEWS